MIRYLICFLLLGGIIGNCSRMRVADDSHLQESKDLLEEFKVEGEIAEDFKLEGDEVKPTPLPIIATVDKAPVVPIVPKQQKVVIPLLPEKKKSEEKVVYDEEEELTFSYPEDYPPLYKEYDRNSEPIWKNWKSQVYIGEIHSFAIKYFGINCATVYLRTLEPKLIGKRMAFHFYANIKSAKFYEYFYTVDDYVETYVDTEDFFPLRYTLIQRESKQNVDDLQLFSKEKLKNYYWYKRVKGEQITKNQSEIYLPRYLLDSVSPLFFFRSFPLKVGDRYDVPIITRSTVWILSFRVVAKEIVKIRKVDVPAIKIQAETHFPGVLKKRGDIYFWYSDEPSHRPLKFEAKVKIGKIEGELINYQEGKLYQPKSE